MTTGTSAVAAPGDTRSVVLRTLLLDAVAARAAAALDRHGVPSILLKGRVTATWLYAGEVRNYGDVDLLVSPALRDRAVDVLGALEYRHWLAGAAPEEYGPNELELVGPHGVCIDLHHTLLGIPDPARCWAVLSGCTERMSIAGASVTVLRPAARAMHLALHVAQNGPIDVKAVADLQRGIAQLPSDTWQHARRLAEDAGAMAAFSSGLHAVDAGRDLVRRLQLAPPRDIALQLRSLSAPPEALQIQNFVAATSLRRRVRLVVRKLWPTRAYMLGRTAMTGAGPHAVFRARLRRMVGLPRRFEIAVSSWYRARRLVRALPARDVLLDDKRELR